MAEKLEVIVTATDQASGILSKIGGLGKGILGIGLGAVTAGAAAAGAGLAALGGGLGVALSEAMGAQEIMTQLDAVLKSTGGAAGVTADMATGLADSLSAVTKFEDDAILAGENMLLTFTNISKDIFPLTTQTMLDMSQAMGQDLQSSAIQVGKALNDPIAGVGALSRVGVQFTEQQKEQIKAMVEAGDVAGAQKMILSELQKEFGGSAEAAGGTFAGQLERLKNTFGNVAESIGTALLPSVQTLADKFLGFVQSDQFQGWVENVANWLMNELPPAIEAFSTFISETLVPTLTEAWNWINANLIPVLQQMWTWLSENLPPALAKLSDFWTKNLVPAMQSTWNFIQTYIVPGLKTIWEFFTITIPNAVSFLRGKWDENFLGIKTRVETVFDNIKDVFRVFQAMVDGDWRRVGELLRDIWDRTWDAIKITIQRNIDAAVEFFKTFGAQIKKIDWLQLGKDIITGIGNGMVAMAEWLGDLVKDVLKAAVDVAKGFLGINSPSKLMADQIGKQMALGIGIGLKNGLAGMSNSVTTGLSMFAPAAATAAPVGVGGATQVIINYQPTISFADEFELEQRLRPVIERALRRR